MAKIVLLASLALLVTFTTAHICLLFPEQRGELSGLNEEGATSCSWTTGPCGPNKTPERPMVEFLSEENVTIVFQLNAAHYYSTNPGYLQISFAHDHTLKFQHLLTIPDQENFTSLSLFTESIMAPAAPTDVGVLQLTYVTNNPDVGTFYQCADVRIKKGEF